MMPAESALSTIRQKLVVAVIGGGLEDPRTDEAARAVGGKVEDREAFMKALRSVEIADAPRGPIKMDPYGNPTQNIYIRKVEKVGGKLQNTVIQTYPAVSQFWKYTPEEFLKQPVYSREFPPCKYC